MEKKLPIARIFLFNSDNRWPFIYELDQILETVFILIAMEGQYSSNVFIVIESSLRKHQSFN